MHIRYCIKSLSCENTIQKLLRPCRCGSTQSQTHMVWFRPSSGAVMSLRTPESIVPPSMLSLLLSRPAGLTVRMSAGLTVRMPAGLTVRMPAGLTVCMSSGAASISKSCIAVNISGVMCGDPFTTLKERKKETLQLTPVRPLMLLLSQQFAVLDLDGSKHCRSDFLSHVPTTSCHMRSVHVAVPPPQHLQLLRQHSACI